MSVGIDRKPTPTDRSNRDHGQNNAPEVIPRRPCSTWHPSRCFGTKRGVISPQPFIETSKPPASHRRQVQPGLRRSIRLTKLAIVIPVGHVPHGIPTDALEHSEA
ncbi:MAG TPA: hypothetical protein DDX19_14705 [Rhodopirellula baltica]|nr:hypothetical protein [Rhodopirellula baltica]